MAIKFNISTIPANATIKSAKLSLHAYGVPTPSSTGYTLRNREIDLYVINSQWEANTLRWSTSLQVSSTKLSSAGNSSINVWEEFEVTSAIKGIIENSRPNNGFLLQFIRYSGSSSGGHGVRFRSSEYSTANQRPKLTIVYEPGSSIKPNLYNIPFAEKYTVKITNIQGREIASFVTKDLNSIGKETAALPSGVHLVRISTPDQIFSKQIRIVR